MNLFANRAKKIIVCSLLIISCIDAALPVMASWNHDIQVLDNVKNGGANLHDYHGAHIDTNGTDATITNTKQISTLNWNTLNTDSGQTLKYVFLDKNGAGQMSLNNVIGLSMSRFAGTLKSEGSGRVIISNPNGIIFENGSFTNVNALTLTTRQANIKDGELNLTSWGDNRDAKKFVNIQSQNFVIANDLNIVAPEINISNANITAGNMRLYTTDGVTFYQDPSNRARDLEKDIVPSSNTAESGKITIADSGITITDKSTGKIYLLAKGDIKIDTSKPENPKNIINGNLIATSGGNIDINNNEITGNVKANADGNIKVNNDTISGDLIAKSNYIESEPKETPSTSKPINSTTYSTSLLKYLLGDGDLSLDEIISRVATAFKGKNVYDIIGMLLNLRGSYKTTTTATTQTTYKISSKTGCGNVSMENTDVLGKATLEGKAVDVSNSSAYNLDITSHNAQNGTATRVDTETKTTQENYDWVTTYYDWLHLFPKSGKFVQKGDSVLISQSSTKGPTIADAGSTIDYGDVTLTNVKVGNFDNTINVKNTGSLKVNSDNAVKANGVIATGDTSLTAGSSIDISKFDDKKSPVINNTFGGNLTTISNSYTKIADSTVKGNLNSTSAGTLNTSSTIVTGAISAKADKNITINSTTANADSNINSDSDVNISNGSDFKGKLTVAGKTQSDVANVTVDNSKVNDLDATASQKVALQNGSQFGHVRAFAADIDVNTNASTGNAELTATNDVTVNNAKTAQANISATGNVEITDSTSTGKLTVSKAADINITDSNANGADLTSNKNITITGNGVDHSIGDVNAHAQNAGSITVTGMKAKSLNLTSEKATNLYSFKDEALNKQNQDAQLAGQNTINETGRGYVSVTNTNVDGASTILANDITVTGGKAQSLNATAENKRLSLGSTDLFDSENIGKVTLTHAEGQTGFHTTSGDMNIAGRNVTLDSAQAENGGSIYINKPSSNAYSLEEFKKAIASNPDESTLLSYFKANNIKSTVILKNDTRADKDIDVYGNNITLDDVHANGNLSVYNLNNDTSKIDTTASGSYSNYFDTLLNAPQVSKTSLNNVSSLLGDINVASFIDVTMSNASASSLYAAADGAITATNIKTSKDVNLTSDNSSLTMNGDNNTIGGNLYAKAKTDTSISNADAGSNRVIALGNTVTVDNLKADYLIAGADVQSQNTSKNTWGGISVGNKVTVNNSKLNFVRIRSNSADIKGKSDLSGGRIYTDKTIDLNNSKIANGILNSKAITIENGSTLSGKNTLTATNGNIEITSSSIADTTATASGKNSMGKDAKITISDSSASDKLTATADGDVSVTGLKSTSSSKDVTLTSNNASVTLEGTNNSIGGNIYAKGKTDTTISNINAVLSRVFALGKNVTVNNLTADNFTSGSDADPKEATPSIAAADSVTMNGSTFNFARVLSNDINMNGISTISGGSVIGTTSLTLDSGSKILNSTMRAGTANIKNGSSITNTQTTAASLTSENGARIIGGSTTVTGEFNMDTGSILDNSEVNAGSLSSKYSTIKNASKFTVENGADIENTTLTSSNISTDKGLLSVQHSTLTGVNTLSSNNNIEIKNSSIENTVATGTGTGTITVSDVTASDNLSATANGDISATNVTAQKDLTLTSKNSSITITNGDKNSIEGVLSATADKAITATNLNTSKDVSLISNNSSVTINGDKNTIGGNLYAKAKTDTTISNTDAGINRIIALGKDVTVNKTNANYLIAGSDVDPKHLAKTDVAGLNPADSVTIDKKSNFNFARIHAKSADIKGQSTISAGRIKGENTIDIDNSTFANGTLDSNAITIENNSTLDNSTATTDKGLISVKDSKLTGVNKLFSKSDIEITNSALDQTVLKATTGKITATDVTISDYLRAVADGNVSVTAVKPESTLKATTLTSNNGSVTFDGNNNTIAGNLYAKAKTTTTISNVKAGNNRVIALGNTVSVNNTNADYFISGSDAIVDVDHYIDKNVDPSISAANSVTMNGSTFLFARVLSNDINVNGISTISGGRLFANNNLNVNNSTLSNMEIARGDVTNLNGATINNSNVTGETSLYSLIKSQVNNSTLSAGLFNANALTLTNSSITTTNGALSITGSTLSGKNALTATNGNIEITSSSIADTTATASGKNSMGKDAKVTISDSSASDRLTATADGDVSITGLKTGSSLKDVNLTSKNATVTLDGTNSTFGGNIYTNSKTSTSIINIDAGNNGVEAIGQDISIFGLKAGELKATANTNGVDITNSTLNSGNITAVKDVNITDSIINKDLLTSTDGDVTFKGILVGHDLNVTKADKVLITNSTTPSTKHSIITLANGSTAISDFDLSKFSDSYFETIASAYGSRFGSGETVSYIGHNMNISNANSSNIINTAAMGSVTQSNIAGDANLITSFVGGDYTPDRATIKGDASVYESFIKGHYTDYYPDNNSMFDEINKLKYGTKIDATFRQHFNPRGFAASDDQLKIRKNQTISSIVRNNQNQGANSIQFTRGFVAY